MVRGGAGQGDPRLLHGWGVRGFNWEFSTSVQRQLVPRVSLDAGYFRRWYGNLTTTDDSALTPADFDVFSITAPGEPRLPGGGGDTVGGFPDLKPTSLRRAAGHRITLAKAYGRLISHLDSV